MPGEAGIGQPDMLAALVTDVRDQQDLGKAGEQVFLDDVNLQLAEPAAEFDMPPIRQVLPAKDDDDVVVKGALDFAEPRTVDVTREIEGDLRTARGTALDDRELHPGLLRPAGSAPVNGFHLLLSHMRFDGSSTGLFYQIRAAHGADPRRRVG